MEEVCSKRVGSPKKTWKEALEHNIGYNSLIEDMAIDINDLRVDLKFTYQPHLTGLRFVLFLVI